MDPEIKQIYDTLTPRAQQVYDVLEKYGELMVREVVNKAQMKTQTVAKCLEELFEHRLASFYQRPRRRKCWFLIQKGRMQHNEIIKTIEDDLAELRNLVKQAEKAYQDSPNEKSLNDLIRIGKLILKELSIPTIMFTGSKEDDRLKHWTHVESELKKLLFYLMNIDMLPIRTGLKMDVTVEAINLRTSIRNSLSQVSGNKTPNETLGN